ncbi:MAG: LytTR family DNA-binding domain-containing protein [Lachnospiraceae bacterium]|nr:LytTR family DNA-binding domain-containing protein [Lachnospiraceae bacterium]
MYQVAVCDDEEKIAEAVCSLLTEWNPQIQVACFSSGEELLEAYHSWQAIFLDIDMGGIDGIETARRIREFDREVKIVYLTAYRDYVSGAFGVHAFQYLLKPVKKAEVWQVLEEIFRYAGTQRKSIILEFDTVHGLVCLPVEEICYFEYENRRVTIVTGTDRYYLKERIGAVKERMEQYGFSMPHQSFVVNMFHVKNVQGGMILLDNGMELPLAQKKQKAWKQELVAYLSGRMEAEQ